MVEQRYADSVSDPPTVEPAAMESWILEHADLKPIHRTCLMLRYIYGMTRAEIASHTALSETQVKGHLQYALSLLRKAYEGRGRT